MSEERKQSRLRELYAYKKKLSDRLAELNKQKEAVDSELQEVNGKLSGVVKAISKIEDRDPVITTHAIERYRERVDPNATDEEIHERIITPQLIRMIATLGNGIYPIDDFQVVIQDNKVVTVIIQYRKSKPNHKITIKERHIKPRKHGR